jgi:hypothetical protein
VCDYRGRESRWRLPLPPNRTGGFPASGSPVGGFTSKRSDERPRGSQEIPSPDRPKNGTLVERVVIMRNPTSRAVRPRRRRAESPSRRARRHWFRVCSPGCGFASTSLRPFAPGPLRPFIAPMGALTPARSVAPVLGLSPAASRSAPREQVSLIHVLGLPAIPSPNTCECSASPGRGTLPHQRVGSREFPSWELEASPLLRWLATSRQPNRVQFPLLLERLLTDWPFTSCCSPPRLATAQLHSVSSHVDLGRTFTSPTKCAFRRT